MNATATAAVVARKSWRTLEPYHGMIYFVPEAATEYAAIGVSGRSGYFGSRSAAMGAVGALVVQATFFNFDPRLVETAMDGLWERTTPEDLLIARHEAVDRALCRMLGDAVDDRSIRDAVDLLRPAVDAACSRPEGRALFAGHARLPEPEMPHVALWWAITLLREFRGDGHIAALVDAELSGIDALLLHGATGDVPLSILQSTRAWPDDEWQAGLDDMRSRGLIDGETLTDRGRELREHIEARTDTLAAPAWGAIDPDDAEHVRTLVRPHSKSISAAAFA
ncbi:SCO6745 family protein [Actinospongicola halichondriae]|uniref:SCO6745 family protein n=1 Tax=Actinospongicola halichondriae TaxID=3236844 RepID=UPI003D3E69DF